MTNWMFIHVNIEKFIRLMKVFCMLFLSLPLSLYLWSVRSEEWERGVCIELKPTTLKPPANPPTPVSLVWSCHTLYVCVCKRKWVCVALFTEELI